MIVLIVDKTNYLSCSRRYLISSKRPVSLKSYYKIFYPEINSITPIEQLSNKYIVLELIILFVFL